MGVWLKLQHVSIVKPGELENQNSENYLFGRDFPQLARRAVAVPGYG